MLYFKIIYEYSTLKKISNIIYWMILIELKAKLDTLPDLIRRYSDEKEGTENCFQSNGLFFSPVNPL